MPGVAEAQNIIERVALSGINNVLAGFGSFFLGLSSYLVTISGTFLSVSINITTHLKDIYENVTAIQSVWRTIRDISSIFIIFSLLYFSIKTILGIGTSGFNSLIVKIFLAGILINFSLFFFKLAIDASNIISLQFYRAIAPNTEQNWTVKQSFTDGGLSNVFMQSLKIPTIYQNNGILKSADVSLAIAFATYAGIIMMVVASLSFLAAAIAFTARTAILLFCLAMSPIYFVGLIFPEIKSKVSDKIMGLLYGQVVFMPVYLFLLYIALRIISDPSFNKIFNANVAGASDPGGIGAISIGVIIQYTIAIFFINLPLVAAIDLGGKGMKWAPDAGKVGRFMTGGFGKNIAGFGKNIAGFAAQHSIGRGAKFASEKISSSEFATRNPNLAVFANKMVGKVSGASLLGTKGGYDKRFKEYTEARTKFADKSIKLSEADKKRYTEEGLGSWESDTESLRESLRMTTHLADNASSDEERRQARKERAQLQIELEARNKAFQQGTEAKYLTDKALKERKEKFAESLEKSTEGIVKKIVTGAGMTAKANKDAAESIRKEINKSEEKKLLDKLQKLAKDAEKESGEETPKTT